jgi:hypothetical protein
MDCRAAGEGPTDLRPVCQVRLVGKGMKAWNKRTYYAVKYLLIGGILPSIPGDGVRLRRGLERPIHPRRG